MILETGPAFLFAVSLAVVHFMAEELEELIGDYREKVISFASGVSITYIFLQLIPEFHSIALESSQLIFLSPLLGFSSIHLAEKYVSKSDYSDVEMGKKFGEIHSVFLFIYHLSIGFLIASLLSQNSVSGVLFFIPILLHVAVSSFSISELHEKVARLVSVKLLISIAPIGGVVLQRSHAISQEVFNPVFGLVIGMFIYVVIRDSIPRGDHGQPHEYLTGMILYTAVILAAQTL